MVIPAKGIGGGGILTKINYPPFRPGFVLTIDVAPRLRIFFPLKEIAF